MYSIEAGCLTPLLPLRGHKENWDYFTFSSHCNTLFTPMEEFGPDIYQLTLINGPTHTTSFINTTVDAKPGYLLNDLLKRHSERDNLWKVYGRTDDQISFHNALKASNYENKFIFLFVISSPSDQPPSDWYVEANIHFRFGFCFELL